MGEGKSIVLIAYNSIHSFLLSRPCELNRLPVVQNANKRGKKNLNLHEKNCWKKLHTVVTSVCPYLLFLSEYVNQIQLQKESQGV